MAEEVYRRELIINRTPALACCDIAENSGYPIDDYAKERLPLGVHFLIVVFGTDSGFQIGQKISGYGERGADGNKSVWINGMNNAFNRGQLIF